MICFYVSCVLISVFLSLYILTICYWGLQHVAHTKFVQVRQHNRVQLSRQLWSNTQLLRGNIIFHQYKTFFFLFQKQINTRTSVLVLNQILALVLSEILDSHF